MCRFLTDILNPSGMHGKGDRYLRSFLVEILGREDADEICAGARVYKEFPITEDRRIDLVIASEDAFIPIEVKIYAGEQKSQCFDYAAYARKKDPSAKVVYLTLYGNEPSPYSLGNHDGSERLSESDCICISFADDIIGWIRKQADGEEDMTVRDILMQYADALTELTTEMGEETKMGLIDEVLKSEERFRGMLAISKIANDAKGRLIYEVLEEFEKSLPVIAGKFNLERETVINWYEYREKANGKFYGQSYSTFPGINYVFTDVALPDGIQMWLRVEVDHALFFGLCLFDPSADGGNGDQVDNPVAELQEALRQYVDFPDESLNSWWVKWWYLPTGTDQKNAERDLVPEFKTMNDAAVRLVDEEKRNIFVQKCIGVIEDALKDCLKK